MRYHVNGALVDAADATVSVRDRGFQYGDAAFETMRAYGGQTFAWTAHYRRLQATCDSLGIDHGLSEAALRGRVHETLAANDLADAYVRLSITRGVQDGRLTPRDTTDPTVVVVVDALPRGGVDGDPVWSMPATVETTTVTQHRDTTIPSTAKTHNYLPGVLARRDIAADADEALFVTPDGHLTEGAASNLFFVADGTLYTPSGDLDVLPGITRWAVAELAAEHGLTVHTGAYTPSRLYAADEAFLTNTTWEVRPIARVDDATYDTCRIGAALASAYNAEIERRHY
ncbi:aminodeoxychorismate lyase [Halobacterium salinarum]|uniref:aminotransferase class IV n=1 Tax=Halobacterium salinarum TaxID=2242 RepID=UPI002554B473|nr:aminodeoxychorismate lyase [Halobacterium salinarum]MDL0120081.1 aminodeoxychorismate lyase [Halobacterium salinarum]